MPGMSASKAQDAARQIHACWSANTIIPSLPLVCRPATVEAGYAIQEAFIEQTKEAAVGWKIAATSIAGQRHINVDGPIAGRLLKSRVHATGSALRLGSNRMAVAEAEFAFVLGASLPAKPSPYSIDEAFDAVASVHPAIEIPDSRYSDFTQVGGPQLIADNACANQFVLGPPAQVVLRDVAFKEHRVRLIINDEEVTAGTGSDALGDPRAALAWIANNHTLQGTALAAGDIVTTGVCGQPSPIKPGDHVVADFGSIGTVQTTIV